MKLSLRHPWIVCAIIGLCSGFFFPVYPIMALETKGRTITISAIYQSMIHSIATDVMHVVYNHMGMYLVVKQVPALRSLHLANEGITDGDMARIADTEKEYQNLIPIQVPVVYIDSVVFTKKITKAIQNWSDLSGLKIGIIQGIRYSKVETKSLDTYRARSNGHLFKLLSHDRIDVAVAVKEAGEKEVRTNYKNSGIHVIGSPLYSAPLYHYVYKKNADLIPMLESTMKNMKKDGTIDTLWIKARLRLLPKKEATSP